MVLLEESHEDPRLKADRLGAPETVASEVTYVSLLLYSQMREM